MPSWRVKALGVTQNMRGAREQESDEEGGRGGPGSISEGSPHPG